MEKTLRCTWISYTGRLKFASGVQVIYHQAGTRENFPESDGAEVREGKDPQ